MAVREETLAISSLPDDALFHILSFLPTKTRVSTTILSTRWINLYSSVPFLDFTGSIDNCRPTDVTPFISFVSMVLWKVVLRLRHVDRLHLCCGGRSHYEIVASWISIASIFNIKELDVSANFITSSPLSPALLTCTTLVDLRLAGNFCLSDPLDVLLPCLKRLELARVEMIYGAGVQKFFSGCPVLESLCMYECVVDAVILFEVHVPSLKRLKMSHVKTLNQFYLHAPNLEDLKWDGNAATRYWSATMKFIDTVDLSVQLQDEQFEGNHVIKLVHMVTHTRSLTLDNDTMKALLYSDHPLPTFHNLTKLSVYSEEDVGWQVLPELLNNTPHLEVLSFPHGLHDDDKDFVDFASYIQEWPEWVPSCISLHLKEVKYHLFYGEENEIKILEYFLKNAKMLEKMVIIAAAELGSDSELDLSDSHYDYLTMKKQFPVIKRLLALPRSSKACRILFSDRYA